MTYTRRASTKTQSVQQNGEIPDPFMELTLGVQESNLAKIAMTVVHGTDYGGTKCSCTVSLVCPQNSEAIKQAGKLAFLTAVEFVNDGMSHLAPETPLFAVSV
jgi:hypothetical protein